MAVILVVEADESARLLLTDVLAKAGYEVEAAADGAQGFEKIQQKNFDLILLDVEMPGLNGLESLQQFRDNLARPRVVVMTAHNTPETWGSALREQAFRYLAKPVHPEALRELVRAALAAPSAPLPIEVVSAIPGWVELLVPCDFDAADRIQNFLAQLKADLPLEVRESVGRAFRELLLNAIEWGGKLDPNRKVRIACLRTPRMLLYRIGDPGQGFHIENLPHAAVHYPPDQLFEHVRVREEQGMRSGGFGIMLAQATVDELLYNEARNEVVFIKYLDQPENTR
jgi:CheY-like chemotaxis protein/anti-sigma regulatory factor (Ser/Thr protein kinase)